MTEWLKQAEIFAFVAAILLIGIAAGDGKEENPPIIVLSEDRDEFRFALGSADLPHAFRAALSETIVPMVEELAAACACDAIELVGHTDGTPVRGGSNLDAHSGHREQLDRWIVNARIGDRERSGATLAGPVALLASRPPSAGPV